ncbi:hypothetical protein E2C01_028583 [Portunus trituberculatus]|uniref:Uncharacterized protein n=1 Tax=Portunus trituberculatus TaxID=210409 RepID=A0A5B7EP53_PORTR|nr:hypothetical protein [Portunus trituberculatus]
MEWQGVRTRGDAAAASLTTRIPPAVITTAPEGDVGAEVTCHSSSFSFSSCCCSSPITHSDITVMTKEILFFFFFLLLLLLLFYI